MAGDVECPGIGEPFISELGIECTFKAVRVMSGNCVDPTVGLTHL